MTNRTDTFIRGDNASSLGTPSDSGGAWTPESGTWGISTDRGYCSTSGNNTAYLESSVADVDVQVTMQTIGTDGGICFRLADDSNYLLLRENSGSSVAQVFQKVTGSFMQLGTDIAISGSSGDVIKASITGSTLKVYINGTLQQTITSVTAGQTNTKHGLFEQFGAATRSYFTAFSITANNVASGQLFTPSNLDGIGAGGPFFSDRLAG